MLHRYKNVITALSWLVVFLAGGGASYASPHQPKRGIAYRTQLGHDLDGDQIPETATVRLCGDIYHVSINFTTGRPKLRLTTYVTEGVAGLSFQTTDVNNDSKGDLVIISATSIRPVAVWVNQGRAKFKRTNASAYGGVGGHTGPTYRVRHPSQPDVTGNISVDPLPQATLTVQHFVLSNSISALLFQQADARPFDSLLRQIPPRGPPSIDHI
jgi:hypothetical protein